MCAIFVPAIPLFPAAWFAGHPSCCRTCTPVAHPGKPCLLPIRPARNAARPAGPVWPFDPFALLNPGSAAGRRPLFALVVLLPELPQRRSCSCCRRRSGHAGPPRRWPWLPRCWPCNDHATQHATHHAAAASRRRGVRPRMQRLRRCSYRDAMHHHATRAPQVATPTVLPLSLRSSCARAFHEATPPESSEKFPGTQYQKGTVFREKSPCGVGEPKIWLVF